MATPPSTRPEETVAPAAVDEHSALLPKLDPADAEARQPPKSDDDGLDKPKVPGVKMHLILPALAIGILLAAMDNTIVLSSYGSIGSEFKSLNRTSWVATAYMLTTTSFQPLYGRMSDIFGRKTNLLFAYVVFGLGCLACGLSATMNQLIVARGIAGIGGGGMATVVSILVSDIVPLRQRGTYQGILNLIFSLGMAAGAPMGGLLADKIGWRWSFLIQVPVTLVAIVVVAIFLNIPTPENTTDFKTLMKRVDFLGASVLIVSIFLFLLGLDQGGNHGFGEPLVIAALSCSGLSFLIFMYVEAVAAEPFAPPRIVREPTIFSLCLSNFFACAELMAMIFYIPLYYQAVQGLNAAQSGTRLIPVMAGIVTGSLGGGLIVQKTGRYYWLTVLMYFIPIISTALVLFTTASNFPLGKTTILNSIAISLVGLGNGVGITTTLVALVAVAGPEDMAVATACNYLFRSLGNVLGVAISSTLVQEKLRTELLKKLSGDNVEDIVRKVRGSMDFIPGLPEATRNIVIACYRKSVGMAFAFSVIMSFATLAAVLFIKEKPLGGGRR